MPQRRGTDETQLTRARQLIDKDKATKNGSYATSGGCGAMLNPIPPEDYTIVFLHIDALTLLLSTLIASEDDQAGGFLKSRVHWANNNFKQSFVRGTSLGATETLGPEAIERGQNYLSSKIF